MLDRQWYEQGFYGTESMADHLRAGAERHPGAAMHFVGGTDPTSIRLGEMWDAACGSPVGWPRSASAPATWWRSGCRTGSRERSPTKPHGCSGRRWCRSSTSTARVRSASSSSSRRLAVLVMPDRWRDIDYRERFEAIRAPTSLEHVVVVADRAASRDVGAAEVSWRTLAEHEPLRHLPPAAPDDVGLVVYTSGTTGVPKVSSTRRTPSWPRFGPSRPPATGTSAATNRRSIWRRSPPVTSPACSAWPGWCCSGCRRWSWTVGTRTSPPGWSRSTG